MGEAYKRIGIFGGTFNPVHYAHLLMAETARDQFCLDRVVFLPTGHSPHKAFMGEDMLAHRLTMTELAIADHPDFVLSDYECRHAQTSYTYQTIRYFKEQYAQSELYFIMGADSLDYFENWVKPEDICKNAVILVAVRDEWQAEKVDRMIARISEHLHARIERLMMPGFHLSSHDIRERIADGRSIRYMVPAAVEEYIREKALYTDPKK